MPPPVGASGMLYRTVIALAAAGRVNSTCSPGSSRTAVRPDASAGSVYAVRSGPITSPFVAAFSASCSRNGTSAPRPATRAGSSAARVTTGAAGAADAAAGPSEGCAREDRDGGGRDERGVCRTGPRGADGRREGAGGTRHRRLVSSRWCTPSDTAGTSMPASEATVCRRSAASQGDARECQRKVEILRQRTQASAIPDGPGTRLARSGARFVGSADRQRIESRAAGG